MADNSTTDRGVHFMKKRFTYADVSRVDIGGLTEFIQPEGWQDDLFKAQVKLVEKFLKERTSMVRAPGRIKNVSGSYGLKHTVEESFDTYIPNGAMILGLWNRGIPQYFRTEGATINTIVYGFFYMPGVFKDGCPHNLYGTKGNAIDVLKQLDDIEALKKTFNWGYSTREAK